MNVRGLQGENGQQPPVVSFGRTFSDQSSGEEENGVRPHVAYPLLVGGDCTTRRRVR